jgi:hypothetical protein
MTYQEFKEKAITLIDDLKAVCTTPNISPPFQGSCVFAPPTQGVALGCDEASRWDSNPLLTKPTSNSKPKNSPNSATGCCRC